MHRRRILFVGIVARMENTRLPKCVIIIRKLVGDAGCVEGQGNEWMGCSQNDITHSFRYQHRLVDDRSLERGGMVQAGGTKGGTFHGVMDYSRES